MKIEIDVDLEKKTTSVKIPEGIDAVTAAVIFSQCVTRALFGVKIEPESKIIKPKMKIFNGASKV